MIEEDFFLALPDDKDEAFLAFEERISQLVDVSSAFDEDGQKQYVEYIIAYCIETETNIGIVVEQLSTMQSYLVADAYSSIKAAVDKKKKSIEIRRLVRLRGYSSSEYALDAATKTQIHHYVNQIRELISDAHLTEQKRDALANRLNAFAAEVDRDRTRLDALTSMYLFAKREATEELQPVAQKIEKILDTIAKAGDWIEILGPKQKKELPPPPKQIEPPQD